MLRRLNREEIPVIDEIIFQEWVTYTGEQWTSQSPTVAAYVNSADSKVYLVGKALYVERTNPIPFIGPEKKGVHYCQVIAPEYLREIIIGKVEPLVCDSPPAYSRLAGPLQAPKMWGCENPAFSGEDMNDG